MSTPNSSFVFWQHDVTQTIPNNLWTPLLFNLNRASRPRQRDWAANSLINTGTNTPFVPASTTIAVGSNGQALPQTTINVADTSAFAPYGWLAVRIAGTDRVVNYTGKTATSFTGCTLGVGTMTTGDLVRQGVVTFKPPFPALCVATAEVQWPPNATGVRGIRFNFNGLGLVGGHTFYNAGAAVQINQQTTEQPAFELGGSPDYIEVFQTSGGNLDVALSNLAAPRLVVAAVSSYTAEPIG